MALNSGGRSYGIQTLSGQVWARVVILYMIYWIVTMMLDTVYAFETESCLSGYPVRVFFKILKCYIISIINKNHCQNATTGKMHSNPPRFFGCGQFFSGQ